MNELALFAGAGGGILGGHLLGWRTICAVEWEPYPASVLCARQNDKILPPFPVWDDVQTFDGNPWRGIVDVVSGGFPCQDISVAGNGAGLDGERSGMWREMARIIGEVRPRYAFVENSPMLVNRGLERVLADLTSMGYDSRWGVISAADVGANHKRERIWIVAHANSNSNIGTQSGSNEIQNAIQGKQGAQYSSTGESCRTSNVFRRHSLQRHEETNDTGQVSNTTSIGLETTRSELKTTRVGGSSENMADTHSEYAQGKRADIDSQRWERSQLGQSSLRSRTSNGRWWETEPNVGRVANGVAARVDRLRAIGNGQVPEVARTAWGLLK